MGNQTRFNLNAEIARWRSQMLARESISSENVRELETHLRDTVTSLTASNLTEEEAFWLAARRLGPPEKLTEEFTKEDPTAKWRNRIFWMAAALFCSNVIVALVGNMIAWVANMMPGEPLSSWGSARNLALRFVLPFLWPSFAFAAGYCLLKGRLHGHAAKLSNLTHKRKSWAALVFIPVVIMGFLYGATIWIGFHQFSPQTLPNGMTVTVSWLPGVVANWVWFTVLGLTVYLLAPGRRAKVAE